MSALHAFFYLHMAETMPPDAPDSWFLQPDPTAGLAARVDTFAAQARALMGDLEGLDGQEAYQSAFYARAKTAFGQERADILAFFQMLYLLLFSKPEGPRWGQFVALMGKERFCALLAQRLDAPLHT